MYGQQITRRSRVLKAIWALVTNVIFWIIIPYYIGVYLATIVPQTPLTLPTFVYEFGVLFTTLDVCAALFTEMAASVPFISAASLLSAVYFWLATNGGNLTVTTSTISIALEFRLLVYVLVLPSIWATVRAPLSYLIWRRSTGIQSAPNLAPA